MGFEPGTSSIADVAAGSDLQTMLKIIWDFNTKSRDNLSGTKFHSRESEIISAIPGKFPGLIAKSTKILGISRGWTMIYAFNWTNMKNTGYH